MNNITKRGILILITLVLFNLCSFYNIYAEECFYDNEDYYIETTITSDDTFNNMSMNVISDNGINKTITRTKTSKIRAKDGTLLWSISIKATFTYNGTSSHCVSYSHSASAPGKTWKIKSVTSSKKNNTATVVGVATHSAGNNSKDFTRSITIKCSKDGIVS